jgi:hypothetical protein
MARELTILIQADGTTAKAALKDVDNAVNTVTDSVKGQEAAMKAALGIFTNQAIRTFVSDVKAAADRVHHGVFRAGESDQGADDRAAGAGHLHA